MAKQEIEMHGLEVDEMDFGSIGKTLSKYGKGVGADPVKPKRSTVHTDYTMTGHKEGKSSTGRVYTKAPEMDREPEAVKAAAKTGDAEAPKRGRGRPAGTVPKNKGTGWSAEAKASMKAKLAARKAAKLAANESEELDEAKYPAIPRSAYTDRFSDGHVIVRALNPDHSLKHAWKTKDGKVLDYTKDHNTSLKWGYEIQGNINKSKNESQELDEGILSKISDKIMGTAPEKPKYKVGQEVSYVTSPHQPSWKDGGKGRGKIESYSNGHYMINGNPVNHFEIKKVHEKNESIDLAEEDWADILEGQSLDSIVEFMLDEEFQSLDELSKATLGSYIKKATAVADNSRKYAKIGDPDDVDFAIKHREYATKKEVGIAKADKRLTKESVDLEEAVTISHDRFERSHGTKAKDKGPARWMFTSKRFGDVNHKDEKEFHEAPHGSFADAKKSAKVWAKKHGHDTAYVMESVEITESTEDLNMKRYVALLGKNLIKE